MNNQIKAHDSRVKGAKSDGSPIIAPSILAADFGNLRDEILSVEKGGADWLHIDVMDGRFVPPITFGANIVSLAKKCSSLFLDVHLMIVEPEKHIDEFAKAGSDRITVHQEVCSDLGKTLKAIRSLNIKCGVSVNPETPIETVYGVLEVCDLVLVMTVNPGWGGQKFIPATVDKIKMIRSEIVRQNRCVHIAVDGGINSETSALCREAGANVFVAGSYVFNSSNRSEAIKSLR